MNCRQVSDLLSAYLDAELTGAEMLALRAHLGTCPACRAEHEALRQTKHLLASLALRAPRTEFESLLRADLERATRPVTLRWLPSWLLAWQDGAVLLPLPRPRPLMTAAALTLTTLLVGTATVHSPSARRERRTARTTFAPSPELYPSVNYVPAVPLTESTPLMWNGPMQSPLPSVTYANYSRSYPPGFRGR